MPDSFLIEDGIREVLLALPAVANVVGSRIRPGVLDEGDTLPAIVITVRNERHENSLDQQGGLVQADVIIHCISNSHRQARLLSKAVATNETDPATGLNGYGGDAGGGTISSCELIDETYVPIAENDDGDTWRHVVSANYDLWYHEPTR